ncbi:gamma-parvin isoform X3 [Tupaia chinensis]|uniref:gamma-parvin isoform X3 n=1 Tax=Tupaia chinensis TaxID=246437 RepID=UPI000FFC0254|nr:gamma-parvin isoform X3 [Tupaia chinensis]
METESLYNLLQLPKQVDLPAEEAPPQGEKKKYLSPTSRKDPKFEELQKVLMEWINGMLLPEHIVVRSLEEDMFDGLILHHLFQKLAALKLEVEEIALTAASQRRKLAVVLEAANRSLQVEETQAKWSVDTIFNKDLLATLHLLVALATRFQPSLQLPPSVQVEVITIESTKSGLKSEKSVEQITEGSTDKDRPSICRWSHLTLAHWTTGRLLPALKGIPSYSQLACRNGEVKAGGKSSHLSIFLPVHLPAQSIHSPGLSTHLFTDPSVRPPIYPSSSMTHPLARSPTPTISPLTIQPPTLDFTHLPAAIPPPTISSPTQPPTCPSINPLTHRPVHSFIHPAIHPPACPSTFCLSFCPPSPSPRPAPHLKAVWCRPCAVGHGDRPCSPAPGLPTPRPVLPALPGF